MIDAIPRGIRNCNPGNIRRGQTWQGMADIQTDPAFIQFRDPRYGIRAIARILETYKKEGVATIRAAINRWAPPNENNTEAYVDAVARAVGVGADEALDLAAHAPQIIAAIIQHENGQQPYPVETIKDGIALA
jgi:hypothetical protein